MSARGANARSVAGHVVTAAMMLLRGAHLSGAEMRSGVGPRGACTGREIDGRLPGRVGFGRTVRHIAVMARAVGMQVAAHDPLLPADDPAWPGLQRRTFDSLVEESDMVWPACSLDPGDPPSDRRPCIGA